MENLNLNDSNTNTEISKKNQHTSRVLKLGKEVKISPKTCAHENTPGYSITFYTETVSVTLGIGKNHVADLIMSKKAWEALNDGEEISITTKKDFIKKYL